MQEDEEILTLVDDEGVEHHFKVERRLELEGKAYALVTPQDSFIFRVESDEDGEDLLVDIEDEEEFSRVADAFMEAEEQEDQE
ncbi:MAG: DUF1292 domain-containing protein [Firmicutes bacterium]|nr:DUF1292 domain-containing protein [Bacillota bacterium]